MAEFTEHHHPGHTIVAVTGALGLLDLPQILARAAHHLANGHHLTLDLTAATINDPVAYQTIRTLHAADPDHITLLTPPGPAA